LARFRQNYLLDTVAAMRGATDLAFGDLIGSNIANMGLILGVAAVARPLELHSRLFRIELPIVVAVSAGLWMMSADGEIGQADGLIMLTCFLAFLLFMYRSATRLVPTYLTSFSSWVWLLRFHHYRCERNHSKSTYL